MKSFNLAIIWWVLLELCFSIKASLKKAYKQHYFIYAPIVPETTARFMSINDTDLLVFCNAAINGCINNPIQQHSQGTDGQIWIGMVSNYIVPDFLIGRFHRFDGIFQRADFNLQWKPNGIYIESIKSRESAQFNLVTRIINLKIFIHINWG